MNWLFQNRRTILFLILLIGVAVYVVLHPWLSYQWADRSSSKTMIELESFNLIHKIYERLVDVLFMAVFFFVGANIGSFLNVVAYRMPLGISVVSRRSRCPACNTGLGPRDNIPVFGWLILGGACRYCSSRISPRYPIVEAILGSVFFLFFWRELISGGTNLPIRTPNSFAGVVWILLYTKWDLVAIYSYHMLLFTLLLTWSLFAWDSHRVPRIAAFIGLLLISIPPLVLNNLVQVPFNHWQMALRMHPTSPWVNGLTIAIGGLVGGGTAMAIGWLRNALGWKAYQANIHSNLGVEANFDATTDGNAQIETETTIAPSAKSESRLESIPTSQRIMSDLLSPSAGAISLICIGIALGWQATLVITLGASILWGGVTSIGGLIMTQEKQVVRNYWLALWPACLCLIAIVHHFYWRSIFTFFAR